MSSTSDRVMVLMDKITSQRPHLGKWLQGQNITWILLYLHYWMRWADRIAIKPGLFVLTLMH